MSGFATSPPSASPPLQRRDDHATLERESCEQSALARFRRALRREDQRVLDDVLDAAQEHRAVTEYDLPFEILLLFVLLAEGKEVLRLRQQIDPRSDSSCLLSACTQQDG